MKTLISIVGTTGIGKTALSLLLAQEIGTEIVSCDSRQFYTEMKIGTAAPSTEELQTVPHHFIGHLSVTEPYSIGRYEQDALQRLKVLFQKYETVILVGGSMMYEKAVIEGLHDLPPASQENQKKLAEIWENDGLQRLQQMLREADPDYFHNTDIYNSRRLLRALDVIQQTGRRYSEIINAPLPQRDFRVIRLGLEAPRALIYDRINSRVDQMLEEGLIEEAHSLLPYRELPALQTVGYAELFPHFEGRITLEQAAEEIRKNSRRFAKRQLTWYRKEENIRWVRHDHAREDSLSLLKEL